MRLVRLFVLVLACSASASAEVGQVSFFISTGCPSGWLPADGQYVYISEYPELALAVIGSTKGVSFVLPPVNPGEWFIRGLGGSRGNYLSEYPTFQMDAFQGHYHSASHTLIQRGDHSASLSGTPPYFQGSSINDSSPSTLVIGAADTDGINGTPRTSAETRPKNIAMLACVCSEPGSGTIIKEVLDVETQNFLFALFFIWLVVVGYRLGKG